MGAFLLRLGIGVIAFMAVLGAVLEIAREDGIDVRSVPNITDSLSYDFGSFCAKQEPQTSI
jgi:hypothetical protein